MTALPFASSAEVTYLLTDLQCRCGCVVLCPVRGTFKDKEDTTGFEMKTSFSTLKSMLVDLGADVVTEALRKYERAQAVKRQRLIDTWARRRRRARAREAAGGRSCRAFPASQESG